MQTKLAFIPLAIAFACGGALAQAPAGTVSRPAPQQNPNLSGGVAQAQGEMRKDVRTAMDGSAMDANKDGMISRKEWDKYHRDMWRSMHADKSGKVAWADVNARMMGNAGGAVGVGGQTANGQGGTPK